MALLAMYRGCTNQLPVPTSYAQEAVRAELANIGDSLAASVVPAVQAALAASLPKELSSAVKAGLDKQLAPAVAAGLSGKPLQEAFRSAFAKQLVPAFEAATQAMFQQIQTAFAAGFEEHLQVGEGGQLGGRQQGPGAERGRRRGKSTFRSPVLPAGSTKASIPLFSHAGHSQLPGGTCQAGIPAGGLPQQRPVAGSLPQPGPAAAAAGAVHRRRPQRRAEVSKHAAAQG